MTRLEAMTARVSTRTFDGAGLSEGDLAVLGTLLAEASAAPGPFGNRIKLGLSLGEGEGRPAKMGTYGLIAGAPAYAAAAVAPGPGAMEDLGWALEGFVLGATAAGLASCWIGGVFSRGAAAAAAGASGSDLVPAVIALGRAAPRPSLAERIVRGGARAGTRRPFGELVFMVEGGEPPDAWMPVLEAVRIAPSASNKQPWRLVGGVGGSVWTLFLDEDRVYNRALGAVQIQNIDMGIAMRHFAEAAAELNLPGAWVAPGAAAGTGSQGRGGTAAGAPFAGARGAIAFGEVRGWRSIAVWTA